MLQIDGVRTGTGLELTVTFGKLSKDVKGDADSPRKTTPQLLSGGGGRLGRTS